MTIFQSLFLGALQGATEFLPVSSSGHLVLLPWLLGWPMPGLTFDAIVHWGTAVAVVVYFWRDWLSLAAGAYRSLRSGLKEQTPASRLAWLIILGTLPAAIIGYLLEGFFEAMFARPTAAAGFLLLTAVILAASEYLGRRERPLAALTGLDALLIGLAQAFAIFPGISRSGATIAAGLARGLEREAAARFSFLLATPVIVGAGVFKVLDLTGADLASQGTVLAVGFVTAAVVGLGCIHFLLRYLRRRPLYPFAIYCALLGIVGLALS